MKAYPLDLVRDAAHTSRTSSVTGQLFIFTDMLSVAMAFALAILFTHWIRIALLTGELVDYEQSALTSRGLQVGLLGIALCAWFAGCGHYTSRRTLSAEAKEVLLGAAIIGLIDGYLQFALKLQLSRLWLSGTWLLSFVLIVLTRVGLKYVLFWTGSWCCRTVIVGTGRENGDVADAVDADPYLGYVVVERLNIENSPNIEHRLVELIETNNISYVLITFDEEHARTMLDIARSIEDRFTIPLGLIPNIKGISFADLELQTFFGHDLIILSNNRRSRRASNIGSKRIFDIIVTICIILILAPILVVVSALIKSDGGPIIYRSPRIGRGGKTFQALKFRSMVPNADGVLNDILQRDSELRTEWEQNFKLSADPRITPVGRFIRKWSLDELPQLFNVLSGSMSLVGPRPLLLSERNVYDGRAFDLYSQVTPGVTGMWQVSGRDDLEYYRRIELNNWYIKNWSSWLDIIILCRTFFVVAKGTGSS